MSETPSQNIERIPSPQEQYQAEIKGLERAFKNLVQHFKEQERDPELSEEIRSLIQAGRFRREDLDTKPELGFTGSRARIVVGDMVPEGNAEGSTYTFYDNDELRIRWKGKSYIQVILNGGHNNRFDVTPKDDGSFEIKVMYLGRRLIGRQDEKGLWISNPDHYRWRIAMDEYEDTVEAIKKENKRWFGRPKTQKPIPAPPPKPPETLCIEYPDVLPVLKEVAAKLQKGFALTASTYEEAAHMLRQPPAIEGKVEE